MPVSEFYLDLLATNKNSASSIFYIAALRLLTTKLRRIETMKTATLAQIKSVKNTLEVLPKLGIELNLDNILNEEYKLGLPGDHNMAF